MASEREQSSAVREALRPEALRAALVPHRPVFANPWDSEADMFACYLAVSLLVPALLFVGGKLMGAIFDFSSHWSLGTFMVAALVGAAAFMTIVGRKRTSLSVDFLTIAGWLLLGLVVAPVVGLAPSTTVAIILYAILLVVVFLYVLRFGRWQTSFLRPISWPVTWSVLALFFAFAAYRLVLFS